MGISKPASDEALRSPSNTHRRDPRAVVMMPQPVGITRSASAYLDFARTMAALAVMYGHLRGLFFIEYDHLQPALATPVVKLLWLITGFGHQSVMVFFVLSGFFISSSVFRKLGKGVWSWRSYIIDRGARLYVVLIPGLLLGLVWDVLGSTYFNTSGVYSSPLFPFGGAVVVEALRPINFVGSLFFVQTRFTRVFGSNGPLWSLYCEFWYYLLFPALLLLTVAGARRSVRAMGLYACIGLVAVWIVKPQLQGFGVWMLGCAVAVSARYWRFPSFGQWYAKLYIIFCVALLCASLIVSRKANESLSSSFAVGLCFALMLHGVVQFSDGLGDVWVGLAKSLAGFSYSLYVLHFPLLLLIRSACVGSSRWQPDATHLGYGVCVSLVVLLYAFGVAQVTEVKTPALRAWILARTGTAPEFAAK